MKTLIVGGGGREDALAWKLSKSPLVTKIYTAPGNAGTRLYGENVAIAPDDIPGLLAFALEKSIDLTVVGPELPLTLGIVDAFRSEGLLIFGPTREAAAIEGSKAFCKEMLSAAGIPTADYETFNNAEEALQYLSTATLPLVVKADGLAAGKGVIICHTRAEAGEAVNLIMGERAFGEAGENIIIEDFLEGEEASYLAITDGVGVAALAPAQDHKAVFEGDKGPNTGGMGAYSPAPIIPPLLEEKILETIIRPLIKAMDEAGKRYSGVLYAGLMVSKTGGLKVLEFNCRFGDPECQPIMMRLEDDLFEILLGAAKGELGDRKLNWSDKHSICVVMASAGYPGSYEKGLPIRGLDEVTKMKDVLVFHAGTRISNGDVLTAGGRVLGVTGLGTDIGEARALTYEAVEKISFKGAYYRKDIGEKALR
ncbi:MAG: phosphoribosylamine--glycine ligase [Thermodesulfobacteriota bacterium]